MNEIGYKQISINEFLLPHFKEFIRLDFKFDL